MIGLFANAVHVAEVEDGFISNRPGGFTSDAQRKAVFAAGGGGRGAGARHHHTKVMHGGHKVTGTPEAIAAKYGPTVGSRVARQGLTYKPPVAAKDILTIARPRDMARRVSEYEDRTGQRWPGPYSTDDPTMRSMPIDPGGAIGQDHQGNPIFRGSNGQPVVFDRRTGGYRPFGLQASPASIDGGGRRLVSSASLNPVKTVVSDKNVSVSAARRRVNELPKGSMERAIAEQDLKHAIAREARVKELSQALRDNMGGGYSPAPGYGTPPSQRGGMRTQEFRDRDGDMIDDRDQDGPGMPRYGSPGYKLPGMPDQRILPVKSGPIKILPVVRSTIPDQRILPVTDPRATPGYSYPAVGLPWGYMPPQYRQPQPDIAPERRYSSSDPQWKNKMLAELNRGTAAGRMAERRVQMTQPGWRLDMGARMPESSGTETLRRVRP